MTISQDGYFIIIDKRNGNILRSTNIFNSLNYKKIFPTGFIAAKKFIFVSLSNGRLLKVNIKDGKTKDIIKPYYTTKEKGTGLGLSIVDKIINDHNGSIKFINTNKGAKVQIVIPK